MDIDFYYLAICECGAITVTTTEREFSMTAETFLKRYGFEVQTHQYTSCNHCVNHWGLDLCACGSGKPVDECDEGFDECGKPYQVD
jgi:hypothetical protein